MSGSNTEFPRETTGLEVSLLLCKAASLVTMSPCHHCVELWEKPDAKLKLVNEHMKPSAADVKGYSFVYRLIVSCVHLRSSAMCPQVLSFKCIYSSK